MSHSFLRPSTQLVTSLRTSFQWENYLVLWRFANAILLMLQLLTNCHHSNLSDCWIIFTCKYLKALNKNLSASCSIIPRDMRWLFPSIRLPDVKDTGRGRPLFPQSSHQRQHPHPSSTRFHVDFSSYAMDAQQFRSAGNNYLTRVQLNLL